MKLKKLIALHVIVLSVTHAFPQDGREYSLTLLSESISLPFTSYAPMHPGFEVGVNLYKKDKTNSTRRINSYLGGYTHRKIQNAVYARVDYQVSFPIKNTIRIDLPVGLGYMHTFYPGEMYKLDTNTGEFKTTKQLGRPHALLNLGIGICLVKSNAVHPFIKQELTIESPFIKYVPIIPHSFLKIGINFKL